MFRLVVFLSLTLFALLVIAGRDTGQLRPNLARAQAQGRPIVEVKSHYGQAPQNRALSSHAPEPARAKFTVSGGTVDSKDDLPPPLKVERRPLPEQKPLPKKQQDIERHNVFTLAQSQPPLHAEDPYDESFYDQHPASLQNLGNNDFSSTWMVITNRANVRQSPSVNSSVVASLVSGEAVTVLGDPSQEWLAVSLYGDRVDGYVSRRLLTPY